MPDTLLRAFRSLRRKFSGTGLGRIPGIKSLYNLMYRTVRPRDVALVDVQGSKMYVNPNETIQHSELIVDGVVDRGQTELFRRMVKPGMVVLDIGANIGYYTCLAARLLSGTGHVYSFEPFPANFELLQRNIEVNHYTNVTAVQKGVGGSTGRVKFYLDRESTLCHTMAPTGSDKGTPFIEIEVVSLDDFFGGQAAHQRVDLIKMDAELAEGLIIGGAKKLLSQPGISIFMEFNAPRLPEMGTDPQAMLRSIRDLGFSLTLIDAQTGAVQPITIEAAYDLSMKLGGHIELLLQK